MRRDRGVLAGDYYTSNRVSRSCPDGEITAKPALAFWPSWIGARVSGFTRFRSVHSKIETVGHRTLHVERTRSGSESTNQQEAGACGVPFGCRAIEAPSAWHTTAERANTLRFSTQFGQFSCFARPA